MQRVWKLAVMVGVVGSLSMACGGKQRKVARVAEDSTTDLSGNWNDTDARLVSDTLIKECFDGGWLPSFQEEAGRRPAIRVRGVVNKTDEHIDAQVFIKNIERAMVNSGKVKVLAQETELRDVEAEQERGAGGALSDDSAPSIGNETGADFVVAVRMSSILDQISGEKTKFYQVNFELISPSTGEKAWIGEKKIKKAISQPGTSW